MLASDRWYVPRWPVPSIWPTAANASPARLTSRLACGLVVGLEPLQAPSRLALLQDRAQRRQLAVTRDVLAWLAEHLTGGGRQLEGALARLETLARLQSQPLDVATVADHFREQVEASAVTVERIAQRVSGHFRVEARQLQSRRRSRSVLLPPADQHVPGPATDPGCRWTRSAPISAAGIIAPSCTPAAR